METSSRRKACDTCFRKKLRCDMLKPTCSNCLLYNVTCGTTAIRRRAAATAATPSERPRSRPSMNGNSVEARLARIESKLDRLGGSSNTELLDVLSSPSGQDKETAPSPVEPPSAPSSVDRLSQHRERSIPPLTEILPVVEDYFRDFNFALPLFLQHEFMRMLYNFYSEREQTKKPGAAWAAINVVLAIGYRTRIVETNDIAVRFDDQKAEKCIDNVQRELDELVTREEDTLGVQVLLGLVMLFQTDIDQKPATILIGTAMRLAHRLKLHVKALESSFSPEIAQHRNNIFWLCYSLDKDVSLRARIPSIQDDDDVDLDLPGVQLGEEDGYLQGIDGCAHFNYLRTRVQLAYVQGKVYDYLLSNRSSKLSREARGQKVAYLGGLLDQWLQRLPESLRLERITQTLEKGPLTHVMFLYHTYMVCSTTLLGLYSLEAPWIQSISQYSIEALRNFDSQAHLCLGDQSLLPLSAWNTCVDVSRKCLGVFDMQSYNCCNLWLSSCAYFSAFIVLLANIVYFPSHNLVDYDRGLTDRTTHRMEKLLEYTKSISFPELHIILVGLKQAADFAADRARSVAKAYETTPPTTQPECISYPPTAFGVFSDYMNRVPVAQPTPDPEWLHASTLDGCGVDLNEFNFDEEIPLPAFMRGFS